MLPVSRQELSTFEDNGRGVIVARTALQLTPATLPG
jgi:hypothetical protein